MKKDALSDVFAWSDQMGASAPVLDAARKALAERLAEAREEGRKRGYAEGMECAARSASNLGLKNLASVLRAGKDYPTRLYSAKEVERVVVAYALEQERAAALLTDERWLIVSPQDEHHHRAKGAREVRRRLTGQEGELRRCALHEDCTAADAAAQAKGWAGEDHQEGEAKPTLAPNLGPITCGCNGIPHPWDEGCPVDGEQPE